MKEHHCQQNTPEWELLRAGIPTASEFDKIVTPKGALSKSSRDYKARLLAERVLRKPLTSEHKSYFMDRGTEFEAEAVDFYSLMTCHDTTRIGFVTNDAQTIGASPDRWASTDGQVEIKVPAPWTHMAYYIAHSRLESYGTIEAILDAPKPDREKYEEAVANSLQTEYKVQTHGQIWITGRKWADLLSYSPEGLPPVLVHLKPDTKFMEILAQSVSEFSRDLEESAADLVRRGIIPQG